MKELIKLKADVLDKIRAVMYDSDVVESYYNKITGGTGACENVPTAFILQNTPQLAYLSQTDQLLMEAEILQHGLPGVWTLGRSYRNEPKAGDGRHLAEFALLEFESLNFDLKALLLFQQKILNAAISTALQSDCISTEHRRRLEGFLDSPAKIITYTEVVEMLSNRGVSINWGDDFTSNVEEMICVLFEGPVQVTHYPESIKFFNMYRTCREPLKANMPIEEYNENRFTVDCVDLLLPWAGETFGGSRREEDYRTLSIKLRESLMFQQMTKIRADQTNGGVVNTKVEQASWAPFVSYLNLSSDDKRGCRSHNTLIRSGFGLGMGRLIQFLLGSTEIVVF